MTQRKRVILVLSVVALMAAAVTFVSPRSVISYFYFLFLTVFVYVLFFRKVSSEPVLLYVLYSALAVALYTLQFVLIPKYFGFSGGLGIGTDDSFFYSQVASYLPANFPTRPDYLSNISNFAKLLRLISPFAVRHPLDILFFNVFGTVFIPIFTRKTSLLLTGSKVAARFAYVASMLCPFIISNSLVLVRDGWTATLFIGGLYLFLKRRYLLAAGAVALQLYLRLSSGGLLVGTLGVSWLLVARKIKGDLTSKWVYITIISLLIIVGSILVVSRAIPYLEQRGVVLDAGTIPFREGFVEGFMARDEGSTFLWINHQFTFIRVPLAWLFYFAAPFFAPTRLVVGGMFVPRNMLAAMIYPLLFLFYIRYIVRGMFAALKQRDGPMLLMISVFVIAILALSQVSLQIRHKTMLMPLMYVLAGYGFSQRSKWSELGLLAAVGLAVLQACWLVYNAL